MEKIEKTYNQKCGAIKRKLKKGYKEEGLRHIKLIKEYAQRWENGDFRGVTAHDFIGLCDELIIDIESRNN